MDDLLQDRLRHSLRVDAGLDKPGDVEIVVTWCALAKSRRPIAFIGAGFSRNAEPVPNWRDLAPSRIETPRTADWTELAALWSRGLAGEGQDREIADPLWLAELYRQLHGRPALEKSVRDALPVDLLAPGPAHKALTVAGLAAIITTNYDELIELGLQAGSSPQNVRRVVSDRDLADPHGKAEDLLVIHAHGLLARPETMTLTLDDYRRYPAQHPGLVAKVRQLMMEHSLLVMGFSAWDPNFVQWQGWLGDFLGGDQVQGLFIAVDDGPGGARKGYWKGKLAFITLAADRFAAFLQAIGAYLNPSAEKELGALLLRRIDTAPDLGTLMKALEAALAWHEQRGRFAQQDEFLSVVVRSVQRALALASHSAGTAWRAKLSSMSAERLRQFSFSESGPPVDAPSAADQREALRGAFDAYWPKWLRLLASLLPGSQLSIQGHGGLFINIDLQLELDGLKGEDAAFLRSRIAVMRHRALLDAVTTAAQLDEVLARVRSEVGNDEAAQAPLTDALARARLRLGVPHAEPDAAHDPQALRRKGFHLLLEGAISHAADAYRQAADRSRQAGEPDVVERLTLETWKRLSLLLGAPASDKGLVLRLEELARRRNPEYDEFERHVRDLSRKLAETLEPLLDQTDAWEASAPMSFGSTAETLLGWCEHHWIRPEVAQAASEAWGINLFREGHVGLAVMRLSCYGGKVLSRLLNRVARRRGGQGLDEVGQRTLLSSGRWPTEWLARVEAMPAWAGEIHVSLKTEAQEWLQRCAHRLLARGVVFFRDGGVSTWNTRPPADIADALLVLWLNMPAADVVDQWQHWQAVAAQVQATRSLVGEIGLRIPMLPWAHWIADGAVALAVVDEVFAQATKYVAEGPPTVAMRLDNFISRVVHMLCAQNAATPFAAFPNTRKELWTLANADTRLPQEAAIQILEAATRGHPAEAQARADLVARVMRLFDEPIRRSSREEALSAAAIIASELSDKQLNVALIRARAMITLTVGQNGAFSRTYRHVVAEACAYLATQVLAAGACARSPEFAQLLTEALELDPEVVKLCTSLPPATFQLVRGVVTTRTSLLFTGAVARPPGSPASARIAACQAASGWVENRELADDLPREWQFALAFLAGADDLHVAWLALSTLRSAIGKGKFTLGDAGICDLVVQSVLAAMKDGRGAVTGAAGAAAIALHNVLPDSNPDRAKLAIELQALKDDPRVSVQGSLRSARAQTRLADSY